MMDEIARATTSSITIWEPTLELRWDFRYGNSPERVLQQRWICISGLPMGKREWRDVPDAAD